jgi:hypothetical protein
MFGLEAVCLARFDCETRRGIYSAYLGDAYDDPPPYGTLAIADLTGTNVA